MQNITLPDGSTRTILIGRFPALDGWEIQEDYIKYVRSDDKAFKKEFTLRILKYAEVVMEETNLNLQTVAVIENHLGNWQNIKQIFEAILSENGIDPESHAEKSRYWDFAGRELSTAFIAEVSKLMGPAFAMVEKINGED